MNLEQWEALIIHLFPADELQAMAESTLDKTIGYFHGETDSVQIPLAPLKARLRDKAGEELTRLLLESQPHCSAEQQAQLEDVNLDVAGALPIICSVSGEMQIQLSAELQRRLENVSAELPDHANSYQITLPIHSIKLAQILRRRPSVCAAKDKHGSTQCSTSSVRLAVTDDIFCCAVTQRLDALVEYPALHRRSDHVTFWYRHIFHV